jgi:hypothetical protein
MTDQGVMVYRKMYQVCVIRCVQHLLMKEMEASE